MQLRWMKVNASPGQFIPEVIKYSHTIYPNRMPILLQLGLNNRIDPLYSSRLTFKLSASVDINTLEKRIDELIALCDELESKQGAMETDRDNWMQERTRLLEKNEMAKAKIEAMIMRLKSLEQD